MDDLARLGVDRRVVVDRLQLGQHLERAAGELGAEEQRLQRRDQRVPAEDGHEPRHPGRRAAGRGRRCRRACAARRGPRPTGRTRARAGPRSPRSCGTRSCQAVSESCTRASSSPNRCAPDRSRDLPPLVRRSGRRRSSASQRPRGSSSTRSGSCRRRPRPACENADLRARAPSPGRPARTGLCASSKTGGAGSGSGFARIGVAEREVVLLDREDVGEVAGDLERELERDRLDGHVLDRDPVLHRRRRRTARGRSRPSPARALGRERVAQVEGGREVLDLPGREQERRRAVHRSAESSER